VHSADTPAWRRGLDVSELEVAAAYLGELLDAAYYAGASVMIRVDAQRTHGANPSRFTVVIDGPAPQRRVIRWDDSNLPRAIVQAVHHLDEVVAGPG
jgi:hypothetical protein